jgi:5-deoxy-glucuronate isomerase
MSERRGNMGLFIKTYDNQNKPIIGAGNETLPLTYFNILRLKTDQQFELQVPGYETIYTVLSGQCEIIAGNQSFKDIRRSDIWIDKADSVYIPSGMSVKIKCRRHIAVTGGRCDKVYEPFRVGPNEVSMIEVGTSETKTHRKIYDVLGNKGEGRTGNLIVKELFGEDGCWSGYPPHKHDTENVPEESAFEELYYYRFNPENGFGNQLIFQDDGTSESYMVRSGDTVCIPKGYHPTVFSPGHRGYLLCILVGAVQRSLILNLNKNYSYLADKISGVKEMQENFRNN